MLHWWPVVSELPILTPRTVIVRAPRADFFDQVVMALGGEGNGPSDWGTYIDSLCAAAAELGYPVFMRTDLFSGKHSWERTCYVPDAASIAEHLSRLIEDAQLVDILGLPTHAIVVREMLDLNARFRAFWGHMPIAIERRYFIRDGKVVCHHPYWPEEALAELEGSAAPDVPNWRDILRKMNVELPDEIAHLTECSQIVAAALPGFWSVDFARDRQHNWWLIDMAEGEQSWHPGHAGDEREPEPDSSMTILKAIALLADVEEV